MGVVIPTAVIIAIVAAMALAWIVFQFRPKREAATTLDVLRGAFEAF